MPFCLSTYHNYHHHHLRLIKCGTKFNCRLYGIAAFFLLLSQTWCSTQDIENSDRVPWHRLAPLDKNKWAIENISHHKQRKKLIQRGEETRKAARCNSYSPPLHLIRSRYPALSKKKRQINIVIHNFRLNPPCFYCFHVLFFLGHSIRRNSDKRIWIDCWWDQRINKWNAFFFSLSPLFFPPKWARSEAMEQNT